MAKGCALSTGYLPRGGLPRNSVDRLTDRPDMTSAVDRGRKASTQTKKQTYMATTNAQIRQCALISNLMLLPTKQKSNKFIKSCFYTCKFFDKNASFR